MIDIAKFIAGYIKDHEGGLSMDPADNGNWTGGGAPALGAYYTAVATDEKGSIGEAWLWNMSNSTKYSNIAALCAAQKTLYAGFYS